MNSQLDPPDPPELCDYCNKLCRDCAFGGGGPFLYPARVCPDCWLYLEEGEEQDFHYGRCRWCGKFNTFYWHVIDRSSCVHCNRWVHWLPTH